MVESVIGHWPSILLYLGVFVVSAILVYTGNSNIIKTRHVRTTLTALGLTAPILLAGIRYYVGHDYKNYAGMVERVQSGEPMWPRAIEPLSSLIINLSASLGTGMVMFFLFSIITILFAYLALKKLVPPGALYISLGWFAYLCVQFPTTLNAVRSGASVSIVGYAFSQLADRSAKYRLIKFLALIGVSSLFHASSLICLPIGLAVYLAGYTSKINVKLERGLLILATFFALILPILGNVVAIIPIELISNYSRYFKDAGSSFYIPIVSLVMLSAIMFTYIVNKHSVHDNFKLRTLYSIALYYIPTTIAVGWLSYYTGTSRITFFFDIVTIALLVYALKESVGKRVISISMPSLVIAFTLVFSAMLLVRNLNWAGALPYTTVFSEETINVRKD